MGISNTQYRDIMFQYDQTRMNNQRILDKRYETLFVEIPELEQIQHDIMDLSLTQARKELFQTEPDPKSEAEYSAKREALLSRKKGTAVTSRLSGRLSAKHLYLSGLQRHRLSEQRTLSLP